MTQSIPDILRENEHRRNSLFSHYDPITGEGSPIERFNIQLFDKQPKPVLLPMTMRYHPKIVAIINSGMSAESYAKSQGFEPVDFINAIHQIRLDHDFEFWAYLSITIKNKDGGDDIRMKPNNGQKKVLKELIDMFNKGLPIRIILLKARQWGGSTLIQIFMFWIQARHKTNWNSLIAAHLKQAAINVRTMLKKAVENYKIDSLSLTPFEGTTNIKIIPERSNKITVGSMETPESIRSDDIAMAHLSEVGLWKKTEGKKPEDLIQSILGSINLKPMTFVAIESTAKGVGNFFHSTWIDAKKNGSYRPIFVAWWELEQYQMPFESEEEKKELIKTFSDYEKELWEAGATLEGIKWHRAKLKGYKGDMVSMASEFPSNDVEAFQSTGQRFFATSVIQRARRFTKPPLYVGEIYADAQKGPEALNNIRIEKANTGNLSVWIEPEIFPDVKYLNRYVVSLDIGGRSKEADDSVIKVWDRWWMQEGGAPELAACWEGKIDFDHLAWKAVQICKLYDDAFFIPEINKMREDTNSFDEGDQFYTLIDEIAGSYHNIFCRTNPEQIAEGMPKLYGFHTNAQTKPMILNTLNAAYRDDGVINYDVRSMDQADTFENKGNGKTGAVEGKGIKDDHVITDAIGVWCCLNYLGPITEVQKVIVRKKRLQGTIADF